MTILDLDRLRIVSIDFIDNPSHGESYADDGELCSMALTDRTTTCHRCCTAYVVSNGKPVTLAMTYVCSDEDEAGAGERVVRRARDIAATVVHVLKKGERMKEKLDTHNSYVTTYRLLR